MLFLSAALALDVPPEPVSTEAPAGPDRSAPPPVLPPSPVELDDLATVELKPGLRLHHVQIPRLRDVSVSIVWGRGRAELPFDDAVEHLFSAQWGKATERYSEDALAGLEERLDLEIGTSVGLHESHARLEGPVDVLDQGLDLLAQVVLHPVFDKRALTLTQENLDRWYTMTGPTDPNAVLFQAVDYAWYPVGHPEAVPPDLERFGSTKAKELAPVHQALLGMGPVDIVVVGDVPLQRVQAAIEQHLGALGAPGERIRPEAYTPPPDGRVIAIPMRESSQVSILHKRVAPAYGHADEGVMDVIEYALGGHFLARFNKNLREDKGWTYGVGSWYTAPDDVGSFSISVDVPSDKLAPAVTELKRELATLVSEGVSQAEIDAGWRSALKRYNDTRSTTSRAASVYGWMVDREIDVQQRLERVQRMKDVTPEQTRTAAATYLADGKGIWLFLGQREGIEAGLQELGLEATWIEPADAILGDFQLP